MGTFRDLTVYKKAFGLAMDIYKLTKEFPEEEKFGLTNQIRRSSRSMCANIGRLYEAHFIRKASDADMENTEVQVWLDFAKECEFISEKAYVDLIERAEEVGRMLNHMIENPAKYNNQKSVKNIVH
jgi:four helix bundle protein